jgi:8-oxo-dGTP pyrophosphatase MutT (NUDIX family)
MVLPWSVSDSEFIIDDRWLRLRADRCKGANGAIIDPFYILEFPDWICVLPLTPDRQVVLTTEYRHGAQSVFMGLPGGTVDPDDLSPASTAERELVEETGYKGSQLIALGSFYANSTRQTNRIHYFLTLDTVKISDQFLDEQEDIELSLMPFAELLAGNHFQQSYHMTCLLLAQRYLQNE